MSIVELVPNQSPKEHRLLSLWYELIGLGPDGLPLAKRDKSSLFDLVNRGLRAKGRLSNFPQRDLYGTNASLQRYHISLTLTTLWTQRLLLCHQLEKKLIRIHGGDTSYRFLNIEHQESWADLEDFFFKILPQPIMFRKTAYSFVPPLEIPLFEAHELEDLLPLSALSAYEKRSEKLLEQILETLEQQDEHLISNYKLLSPIPKKQAQDLTAKLFDLWWDEHVSPESPAPTVCDPIMHSADLLIAMMEGNMRRLYGKAPEAYQVSAGPGGFNRHVPHKIQQLHSDYYREMADFADKRLFGVAPDGQTLSWVKLQLWSTLLHAVPFDAASNYELLFPLPKFRYKLCHGPALMSQYRIDSKMKSMLKGNKLRFGLYCSALDMFQHAQSEKEKEEARGMLEDMQKNFRAKVQASHPDFQRLKRLEKALLMKENPLFGLEIDPEAEAKNKLRKLQLENQIKLLKIKLKGTFQARQTFEWRFHFPELLNPKDASFVGFDIVLLHPHEPKAPEMAVALNQSLSLTANLCCTGGWIGTFLPDNFEHKKAFQKGRKIVFEQLKMEERNYVEGQGFEEMCTGKLRFVLHKA